MVGVFGRNGVGKTTLLKTIAGWIQPSRGEIAFDGARIDGAAARPHLPPRRRLRAGGSAHLSRAHGGGEPDARLHAGAAASAAPPTAPRWRQIYRRFPRLRERRRQHGTTLSGGEQQMLAMARVLVGEPRLLLVDEPSEGLAPMIVAEIFAILRELKQAGRAILLVEQNVPQALTLCDRFVAIERGRVTLAGDASAAADCARLMAAITV